MNSQIKYGVFKLANPLRNEAELYKRIETEGIYINALVWDDLFKFLGDYITAINLICYYYINQNENIPVNDAEKILKYAKKIIDSYKGILHGTHSSKGGNKILNTQKLDPIIDELFSHYMGNDIHAINLCVSFYLDSKGQEPIPVEDAKKVYDKTISMSEFLHKLRKATV